MKKALMYLLLALGITLGVLFVGGAVVGFVTGFIDGQKLSDLGTALSYVCEAFAHFQHSGKNAASQDAKVTTSGLYTTADILKRYGLKSADDGLMYDNGTKTGTISNANANKMQTNIQYMMDKEDNYLQQDMVSLQSYFSRRDQALSLAASLVRKVNNTMSSGIQAIR